MVNNVDNVEYHNRLVRLIRGSDRLEGWEKEAMLALVDKIAIYDPLTGLLNKSHLEGKLQEEFSRARRHGNPLSVIMFDVDNFKLYNNYGQQQGDAALAHIGRIFNRRIREGRKGDIVGRYGGEEFLMILPQTELTGAIQVADGLCGLVKSTSLDDYVGIKENSTRQYSGNKSFRELSVSAGIAVLASNVENAEQLVNNANLAMRTAKSLNKGGYAFHNYEITPPNPLG